MGLEAASFIEDLNAANPVGATDTKAQGDDHIRLMKAVLKATLPGLIGRAFRSQTKAGAYTGVANDNLTMLKFTATATLSLTAAATLGNGWMTFIEAEGGVVTVDPNSTELVNGASTVAIPQGNSAILFCDGSAFQMFVIKATFTEFARLDTEDQALTGGVIVTSKSLGTISTGTVTPDPGDRPMQHYTNGGAHTLAPSTNVGSCLVDITNDASAGAITTSGFTIVTGDAFTTTSGNKFRCHISVGNAGSLLHVTAMQ